MAMLEADENSKISTHIRVLQSTNYALGGGGGNVVFNMQGRHLSTQNSSVSTRDVGSISQTWGHDTARAL